MLALFGYLTSSQVCDQCTLHLARNGAQVCARVGKPTEEMGRCLLSCDSVQGSDRCLPQLIHHRNHLSVYEELMREGVRERGRETAGRGTEGNKKCERARGRSRIPACVSLYLLERWLTYLYDITADGW